jgi:osmoprotectant transport system substrate-binding protein
MQRSHPKRGVAPLAAALLCAALAACGSSSSSSGTPKTEPATKMTPGMKMKHGMKMSTLPGAGKPAVVLGDKNFDEEYLLGSLYQEALQAQGYTITLKGNIGSTELAYKALQTGQIQMYPEYDGTLLTVALGDLKPPTSAAQTYRLTQADAKKAGFELSAATLFADADALATLKSYATAHGLKTLADLAKAGPISFGAPAEARTRFLGLLGLEQEYGLHKLKFTPLAEGLNYKALDSGQVKVALVFTTDPQLASGKYTVLTDTKGLFGYQNVAMVLRPSLATAEGPAFLATIDKVRAADAPRDHQDERGRPARQPVARVGRPHVPRGQRPAQVSGALGALVGHIPTRAPKGAVRGPSTASGAANMRFC